MKDIVMRGYEKRYFHPNDEVGVVSGGRMWISNQDLHFDNGVGLCSDIKNAPFEYKDIMLSTGFQIGDEFIFEKDIIKDDLDEEYVVKMVDGSWCSTNENSCYNLYKVLSLNENITVVGSVPEREDNIRKQR